MANDVAGLGNHQADALSSWTIHERNSSGAIIARDLGATDAASQARADFAKKSSGAGLLHRAWREDAHGFSCHV